MKMALHIETVRIKKASKSIFTNIITNVTICYIFSALTIIHKDMYIKDTVHQKIIWCKRNEKCNDTCLTMAEGTIEKIF